MNQLIESEINRINQQNFEIQSNEDLIKINAVLKGIKALKQKVKDEIDPRIQEAHKTHKGLTEMRAKYLKPLEEVEAKINTFLKAWTLKKEAEAKVLQEKINKELAEKVEVIRLEKLKEAENCNNQWEAEIKKEEAFEIKAVTVDLKDCKETVAPKQEGQYRRSNWKAKVIDVNLIPRSMMIPNEAMLNAHAKNEESRKIGIPGVEFFDDFTIVTKI